MTAPDHPYSHVIALDVGAARIGVAVASVIARLPRPHSTVANDAATWATLHELCQREHVGVVVVGLPRGLDGQETEQTRYCLEFADTLSEQLGPQVKIIMQDEALTSRQASEELTQRGKQFEKGDSDALAAVYILEDYFKEHGQEFA